MCTVTIDRQHKYQQYVQWHSRFQFEGMLFRASIPDYRNAQVVLFLHCHWSNHRRGDIVNRKVLSCSMYWSGQYHEARPPCGSFHNTVRGTGEHIRRVVIHCSDVSTICL